MAALHAEASKIKAPFFFPGHGMGRAYDASPLLGQLLRFDLPELPEIGTLDANDGPLREAQALAARGFGAKQTWFLVNGSSGGVLAAVLACVQLWHHYSRTRCSIVSEKDGASPSKDIPAPIVALPRNCHRSAINALLLSGAAPHFLEVDSFNLSSLQSPARASGSMEDPGAAIPLGINVDAQLRPLLEPYFGANSSVVEAHRNNSPIAAVLLVSPTYHGVVSDISAASALCRRAGVPLIVDEAHGSHLYFMDDSFAATAMSPASDDAIEGWGSPQQCVRMKGALSQGVDIVIQSTHKTLTAASQAGMLHLGSGGIFCHERQAPPPLSAVHNPLVDCPSAVAAVEAINEALQILQTSSPNALLLASLDLARHRFCYPTPRTQLPHENSSTSRQDVVRSSSGARRLRRARRLATIARASLIAGSSKGGRFEGIGVLRMPSNVRGDSSPPGFAALDPLRLTVYGGPFTSGFEADDALMHRFGVYCELPEANAITFAFNTETTAMHTRKLLNSIASICASGSKDPFVATSTPISSRPELSIWQDGRLLTEADADFPSDCDPHRSSIVSETTGGYNMHARSPRESFLSAQQSVSFVDAVGRISADVVCIYPPGIPLLIPGQVITKAGVDALDAARAAGGYITGCVTTGGEHGGGLRLRVNI